MKRIILIGLVLLLLPTGYAREDITPNVTISFGILTTDITDLNVLGDQFIYNISLLQNNNNIGNLDLLYNITVYDPFGAIIIDHKDVHAILISGINKPLTSNKNEERLNTYPLDTAGTYKVKIKTNRTLNYYRLHSNGKNTLYENTTTINYTFDVMPKWQYDIFIRTQEANDKILEANDQLLNLTNIITTETHKLLTATYVLLIITISSILYPKLPYIKTNILKYVESSRKKFSNFSIEWFNRKRRKT